MGLGSEIGFGGEDPFEEGPRGREGFLGFVFETRRGLRGEREGRSFSIFGWVAVTTAAAVVVRWEDEATQMDEDEEEGDEFDEERL